MNISLRVGPRLTYPLCLNGAAMEGPELEFWAKTTGADNAPGISVHDHCLNVGCVAEALIAALPPAVRALLPPGAATLAALHDVGKITPGFQAKCDAWIHNNHLVDEAVAGRWKNGCETDHAKVSQWTLQQLFQGDEDLFRWAMAVGAHHGRIKGERVRKGLELRGSIGDGLWEEARCGLAGELVTRFGALPAVAPSEAMLWWLAGLITVADWIGSDETLFPPDGSLPDRSRNQKATSALSAIRWQTAALRSVPSFDDLFPGFDDRPLQRCAFERIDRPGVYLIEGAMGCGKTEAALAAAYKLIAGNHAGGLYFALPTQTTSNKIHERVAAFLRRIEARPHDLRLAHGSAWLREELQLPALSPTLSAKDRSAPPDSREEDEANIAQDHVRAARSWFASGKRALLSAFGVGTVDQALLGVVAAKHFFVRQFGLAGKVVILDEIHTCDLYTGTLLDNLVKRLRELRCTVLILSATLTARRREQLLRSAGAKPVADGNVYPLLTLAPEGADAVPVSFPADTPKTIQVATTIESDAAIASTCLERAEAGECVLWIRNTVDDAQATYRLLKNGNRQDGPPIGLLHARFPLWRREQLEQFWLEALGKESKGRPHGCVLVATQVVEQSVDIDADFLVTDLAPTDMLLQRIGRLWRHTRPNRPGNPEVLIPTGLTRENLRGGTAADLKTLLGRSGFVYAPYVLLRTIEVWHQRSRIELPADIRTLIEKTYDEPQPNEPAGWIELSRELDARRAKLREAAVSATLVLRQPALADEEGVQTRWNDRPTAQLLLAAAPPVTLPGHIIHLPLADGTAPVFPDFRFDVPAARAVHSNLVRVPKWAVNSPGSTPEWLARLASPKTVLGIVGGSDGRILIGDAESGLTWHPEEGITLPRRSKAVFKASTPNPDYDDDEPND